jgi:hypothetical protein
LWRKELILVAFDCMALYFEGFDILLSWQQHYSEGQRGETIA